nr:metallophosphoesterase [Clostridia bacterium]
MKKGIKGILKTLIIVLVVVLVLFAVAELFGKIFRRGVASSELWSDTETFVTDDINSLVKKDGEDFRILVLTDIQLAANPFENAKALKIAEEMVERTNPDFIMTTGDNVSWFFSDLMTNRLVRKFEGFGIPWGVTLGNHDSEWIEDRLWNGNRYEEAENSLFEMGPGNIHGVGNYVVNITDESNNPIYSLIMLDSNSRRKYDEGYDYDYIYYDQIKWYEWVVKNQAGVPSMLFFHIPLPEFKDALTALENGDIPSELAFGDNREDVFSAPVNTGFFDIIKELGSTTHIFSGHDHVNNSSIEYEGIRLTYCLKTGPSSYSDKDKQGATLVTIKDGTNEIIVEHIYH